MSARVVVIGGKMKQPTVISTFAGGGGSSLGYKWAGFKELLAIDFDKNAVETFRANFPDVPIWERDIRTVQTNEILELCKIKVGELDVFDGSPPCQGFSTAGKRQVKDERNDLFKPYANLIKELQPKVFVMENVSGMIKGKMKGKFLEIMKVLKGMNYNVKVKLMNAKYYEVPQSRERLIFIGVRNDLNVESTFPTPLNKIITVREVLSGLINIENELSEAFNKTPKYIKPLLEKMKDYETASKYSDGIKYFSHKRNGINKPSRTILKQPDTYHHCENRLLTLSELKILSSFPKDYIFVGDLIKNYNRIGNAVMPKMMYHIAKNIRENILEKVFV
jgi:DNA (cytosine-5)-methyltransferase 1